MRRADVDQAVAEHAATRAARALVDVVLRGDCTGARCPTVRGRAELDTGGTHTFVAPSAVEALGLEKVGSKVIRGLGGKGQRLARYAVHATVAGVEVPLLRRGAYAYPALDARGDGSVLLVGRDAMAGGDDFAEGMVVEYDGPRGRVAVRRTKTKRRSK